ncbi:relaxase/mobilization nuclease RlxS [Thalassobaculum sp. OXR-137]|uniref:relaxase/mobilization nuclease RlxS n=1 Tax=Thalassobaculum sp. OXR-137 TaxID=3100173 RepID=UPI002AC9ADF2|nr:relaxase/mobilization nuclease RlxS [Thalassobaculum sp. OXR-137]WPZ35849.1 relaxase/mobilization nuclease RlxS [Thalassobaculum sp. OXR-137]
MSDDDDFKPKLGKIRSRGSKSGRKFLHQVLAASNLAGGSAGKSGFSGSRIGRGAGVGRVLASRDRHAAFRQRRVIIKSRIVRLAGKGMNGARAHLRYIQRDGVTRDGEPGQLYNALENEADGKSFLDRADGDRHQFRFIVAPEDGADYEDLKPLTRRLMARMEEDLGTKLDWAAVDHFNTGHPHTHIMLRGKDDHGHDLIIARDYITTGMRERAAEIVSLDLGPRTDREIENRLRHEVEQERLTSIDRRLMREMDENGIVSAIDRNAFQQTLRAGRLKKLARLGLAEELRPGGWRLEEGLEDTLRRMGERGDIIKTLHREMAGKDIARSPADYVIHDPADPHTKSVTGRVMKRGLSDEINDRHYLIVDGVDGRAHYIDIGKGEATEPTPEGNIIRVASKSIEPRKVDRTIAEIAAANGGRYNIDIHLKHDPRATENFAETHVRRLEAIRRATDSIEREPNGTWIIAPDHLDRVADYERGRAKAAPVIVEKLSHLTLDQQIGSDGATWLDRELVSSQPETTRDSGFGRDLREAQSRRRQWLIAEGLAREEQGSTIYRANMLTTLRRRELTRVAGQLSEQLGLAYAETRPGDQVEGTLRRSLELASGKYAVIEKSREFTLVPWRPVLDRHIGQHVSGIMRADSISWTIGRQKGLGIS